MSKLLYIFEFQICFYKMKAQILGIYHNSDVAKSLKMVRMHYIYIVLYMLHPLPHYYIIVNSRVKRLQSKENYIHLKLAQLLLYETSYYLISTIML